MIPRWCHAVAFALCAMASDAYGQVYKCVDDNGRTVYSDAPCASGSKPIKLSDPTEGRGTNPNVCVQLLDETQRLAAEADREAKRGHTESTKSANRRKSLTRQYEQRCVGIARSEPSAK